MQIVDYSAAMAKMTNDGTVKWYISAQPSKLFPFTFSVIEPGSFNLQQVLNFNGIMCETVDYVFLQEFHYETD